ncbi:UBX domain-containing protein 1, partial [Tanacetum coccineum]
MVVPDVDAKLLEELESMGFSKERSTRTLHFSELIAHQAATKIKQMRECLRSLKQSNK